MVENLGQCTTVANGHMMNVSGGRLLLFVTQLTDGPHITFYILEVALLHNGLHYILSHI